MYSDKEERTMYKKMIILLIAILALLNFTACGNQDNEEKNTTKKIEDSENIAVNIGDNKIYLDEAKYYLYTSQASYETYYLTQDIEIDWDSKMIDDSTWEEVVKGATLDDICRRECMYSLRQQYNVSLTDDEMKEVEKNVEVYYTNTDEKLQNKIGVEKDRLKDIFVKKMIAEKIETVLEAMSAEDGETGQEVNSKKADEIYKEWKSENEVMATECYRNIHFDEPIFTKESLTANPIIPETTTSVVLERE